MNLERHRALVKKRQELITELASIDVEISETEYAAALKAIQSKERKASILLLKQTFPHWTYEQIGKVAGCTLQYVGKVLKAKPDKTIHKHVFSKRKMNW